MNDPTSSVLSTVAITALCGGVPGVMVWGWVRWIRREETRTLWLTMSRIALASASASALLVFASILYARSIPGYNSSYPDPLPLVIINRSGAVLSLVATATAIGGAITPNLLRWHALVGALGVLLFWLAAGMGM